MRRADFSCHRRSVKRQLFDMLKLYSFIGATVGSYAGWAVGAPIGFTTAFMISMVGTGLGIYAGRRVARYYGA
jgi:hypothetical protein